MKDITLLDGSIGQELVKRAGKKPTAMWSTAVLIDQPNLVREVHNDYFSAGASVATTNTYPVLKNRLEREGLADQIETLWARAVQTACAARQAHGAGRVAGAIGPLVASYRPELCPPAAAAAALGGRCALHARAASPSSPSSAAPHTRTATLACCSGGEGGEAAIAAWRSGTHAEARTLD